MLALLAVTAYGMMGDGLYLDELWLPVAAGVLALLFATLFARGFYTDLPPAGYWRSRSSPPSSPSRASPWCGP